MLLLAVVLGALGAALAAQGVAGHFYQVNYYRVQPGQEKAYDSALAHVVAPVLTELVKRKGAVFVPLADKGRRLGRLHESRNCGSREQHPRNGGVSA